MTFSALRICVALGVVGFAATAAATTNFAYPSKDAMIFATSSNVDTGNSSGKGPGMFAGADGSSNKKRSLVRFDLSAIPTTAIVDTVTLNLIVGQIAGSGGGGGGGGGCGGGCTDPSRNFRIYTITTAWNEGPSGTPTSPTIGGTGQGWTTGTGDTSWTYTNYNGSLWTNGGGDYSTPEVVANTFGPTFTVGMTCSFVGDLTPMVDVNPDFVDDVQGWVTNPSTNQGWLIKSDLETSPTSFLGFWTKDGAAANMNNGLRPELVVVWH
ncbi:MAG TPA: hypothetical protein VM734_30405 [Kofleriaceae bacterium]|nr:hypothetical protein [Kofleriaceae bacterium]